MAVASYQVILIILLNLNLKQLLIPVKKSSNISIFEWVDKKIKEKDARIHSLTVQMKEKVARVKKTAMEKIAKTEEEAKMTLKTRMDEKDANIHSLSAEMEQKDANIHSLKAEMDEKDAVIHSLKAETELVVKKSEEKDANIHSLKAEMEQKDAVIHSLKAKIKKSEEKEQEAIIHSLKAVQLSSMLYIPYDQGKDSELVAELQRDLSWFDTPLSIQPGNHPATGSSILKIQMKSTETAIAAYLGLKTRYPELKMDKNGN